MVMIKRDIVKDTIGENGLSSLKRGEDMKNKEQSGTKEIEILQETKMHLSLAAKYQPCPACKHDIEALEEFVDKKMVSLQKEKEFGRENLKALDSIDFINEITGFGITITRIIGPFTRSVHAPDLYRDVLKEDMEPNRKVREELIQAKRIVMKLPRNLEYSRTIEILDSFIKAVEFKLSIDPVLFYVFDKTVRFGYKTHILSVVGHTIVALKKLTGKIPQ